MNQIISIIILLAGILSAQVNQTDPKINDIELLYNETGLDTLISRDLFNLSIYGYNRLLENASIPNTSKLTIIDFSKASTEERFFVIDIDSRKLLFASHVAHGKNSGRQYAKNFSNMPGSLKSSLGFYITSNTYYGKHGYSLRLKGLESSFNGNAEDRAIVMHAANYVSEKFIKDYGRLGRSWGCPALPQGISKQVIDKIKDGTCLFIFANDDKYLQSSPLLQ
jgi:hypothetical protein